MAICYGDIGQALSKMCPSGAVEILGERIDARSDGTVIEAGSWVMVIRGDPTGYVVQQLNPDQTPQRLPNHGQPIRKAEFQMNRAEAAALDRQEQAEKRKRRKEGLRSGVRMAGKLGAFFGLGAGALGLGLGWAGRDDPAGIAILFGVSFLVGVASFVILFFVIALVAYALGSGDG